MTKLLSSTTYPTLGDLRTVFYVIMEILDDAQIELDSVKESIAKKISNKIDHYWDELQSYFYKAVFLDPSTKFATFGSNTQKHDALLKIRSTSSTLHNDVLEEYLNAPDEDANVLAYWKSKSSYLR
ncbi:563_t:CDS:2 [Gigaspora rosea]|nr:563_t:CDS:2 [Gigaspora rosea]